MTFIESKKKEEKWYEWVYRNTVSSKTFWGVIFIVAGAWVPGIGRAGEALLLIGAGDKIVKNRAVLASLASTVLTSLIKKGDKK